MREESFKCGIPAIHSRLPEGPNPEYDDGEAYVQDLVFRAEYDFRDYQENNRGGECLDWTPKHLSLWGDQYRTERGFDYHEELRDHKRHGE